MGKALRGMVNYYEILGIGQDSTAQQIKKSFRKRAKEIHPDLRMEDKERAESRMRLLLAAYEVLGDIRKRVEYDRALSSFFTSPEYLPQINDPTPPRLSKKKASSRFRNTWPHC